LKSFVRKDGTDAEKIQSAKDEDPGNPSVNFRGEKRCNDTHQSTTDPQSVLYRKAHGKEAKLCFGGHILMENRNGLCADFTLHNPITEPEPALACNKWTNTRNSTKASRSKPSARTRRITGKIS